MMVGWYDEVEIAEEVALLGVEEVIAELVVDEEFDEAAVVEGQGYGTERTFVPIVVDHQYMQSLVVDAGPV
jgi:hypothetical protein